MQKITLHPKKIAYVAAHSGGHIIPALTHAHTAIAADKNISALFFASSKPLDASLLQRYKQSEIKPIYLPLPHGPAKLADYPLFAARLALSFCISFWKLLQHRPEKIISMGGIISLPVCLASIFLRIPYELYELNVQPGKAIQFLAPYAAKIAICFEQTRKFLPKSICQITSYPLRYSVHPNQFHTQLILNALHFCPNRITVLILGGSQGSHFMNQLIKQWLTDHPSAHTQIQIIHQQGSHDTFNYQHWYTHHAIPAITFPYTDDLALYYQAADICIARAGAGTIAELQFFKTKALLIPLATQATAHQRANAQAAHTQDPALFTWVEQDNPQKLYPILTATILNPPTLSHE